MKRIYTALMLLFCFLSYSQQGEQLKKLKALKTTFITSELQLTEIESEKFWPIYNLYEKENFELKTKKMRQLMREINQTDQEITEEYAQKKLKEIVELEDKIRALDKKLIEDLKMFLSHQKILKLKIAESKFQKNLMQQRAQRRKN